MYKCRAKVVTSVPHNLILTQLEIEHGRPFPPLRNLLDSLAFLTAGKGRHTG